MFAADAAQDGPAWGLALTEAQEGLWYAQALDPANPAMNRAHVLDLRGPLNRDVWAQAVARTIAETPALALRFRSCAAGPRQWPGRPPMLGYVDVSARSQPLQQAHAQMQADLNRPLDLAQDPAGAVTLFVLGPDHHLMYLRLHQLACDDVGIMAILHQMAGHYLAMLGLGRAPRPFRAWAHAIDQDRFWRHSPRRQVERAFWLQRLTGSPAIPAEHGDQRSGTGAPARPVSGIGRFEVLHRPLPARISAIVADQAASNALAWPDLLAAIATRYLSHWMDCALLGIGHSALADKDRASLPCMSANILPHAPDSSSPETSVQSWLTEQSRQLAEARAHGRYRSEHLRRDLGMVGSGRRLFGAVIDLQPQNVPPNLPQMSLRLQPMGGWVPAPLLVGFHGRPDTGLSLSLTGENGVHDIAALTGLADGIEAVIEALPSARRLKDLPLPRPPQRVVGPAPPATLAPPPRAHGATETLLGQLVARILGLPAPPGPQDDFFALGGDSLAAVRLAREIGVAMGRTPGLGTIFAYPMLGRLAAELDTASPQSAGFGPALLLAPGPAQMAPLFLLPPAAGLSWAYRALAQGLHPPRRVYGLQHPMLMQDDTLPASLPALARHYAAQICELAPDGPLHLAGWAAGGILAQEVAVILMAQGRRPGMVALLDSYPAELWRDRAAAPTSASELLIQAGFLPSSGEMTDERDASTLASPMLERALDSARALTEQIRAHHHRRYQGKLIHFQGLPQDASQVPPPDSWAPYAEAIEAVPVPLAHQDFLHPDGVLLIASELGRRLAETAAPTPGQQA